MSIEQQTGIPTEYLHQEAKITIDMDSTAESYLRRGISRQDFLKFVYQLTELMEMSIKCGLQMDFDLKNIEVCDEQVYVKTCIGDDGLDIKDIKEYLKTIAYKTVFVGEDFLQSVYEYLSFIDSDKANTIENISAQIELWMNGATNRSITNVQPVQKVESKMQRIEAQVERMEKTMQRPQPSPLAGLDQIPPAQMTRQVPPQHFQQQPMQQQMYSDAGETGVLDPSFWSSMMQQGQSAEDPNRIRRQSKGAFLYNPMTNERVDINKTPFTIGKSLEADYVMQDSSVSRIHAEITSSNGRFFITDPSSTNGTHINEKQIPKNTPIEIVQNDTIRIAKIDLKFQVV